MSRNAPSPKRGEVWDVNFDPTIGAEIRKIRSAVVISSDAVGKLPIRLVVPITEWKPAFAGNIWHVQIEPDASNGLTKVSAVDVLQARGVDVRRFVRRRGYLSAALMEEIATTIARVPMSHSLLPKIRIRSETP